MTENPAQWQSSAHKHATTSTRWYCTQNPLFLPASMFDVSLMYSSTNCPDTLLRNYCKFCWFLNLHFLSNNIIEVTMANQILTQTTFIILPTRKTFWSLSRPQKIMLRCNFWYLTPREMNNFPVRSWQRTAWRSLSMQSCTIRWSTIISCQCHHYHKNVIIIMPMSSSSWKCHHNHANVIIITKMSS